MGVLDTVSDMNVWEQGTEQATRIAALSAVMLYLTATNAPVGVFEALGVIRADMKHSPTREEVMEHAMAAHMDARAGK